MSGLEIVGLAASVLQIADCGWKISYKLYAFSKKVHEAGKTIELISQDISATGAVLKQLGDRMEKDVTAAPDHRICSQGLIIAASKLVEECKDLFTEIDVSIGGKDGNKVILGFKQKLKWSYLEPRVELLRANLERLKSSLAIMLNILIYAEQLRSREERTVLTEQQILVASFVAQKSDAEQNIGQLNKSIENGLQLDYGDISVEEAEMQDLPAATGSNNVDFRPWHNLVTEDTAMQIAAQPSIKPEDPKADSRSVENTSLPKDMMQNSSLPQPSLIARPDGGTTSESKPPATSGLPHLEHHRLLIENILAEVNSSRYAIDHGVRYRLHDGILNLHWNEWSPLRSQHEDDVFRALLTHSPVLARHWHECLLAESSIKMTKENDRDHGLVIDYARPMYIRVRREYLSPITLNYYSLPWEYDRQDSDFLVIKQHISHELQDDLFEHTRNLKDRELLEGSKMMGSSGTGTRPQQDDHDLLVLDMEETQTEPDNLDSVYMSPVTEMPRFEDDRLKHAVEGTPYPPIREGVSDLSADLYMERPKSSSKRAPGRTRPSQCDAVLIGQLDPNRPEIATHAGEYALDSGSQPEADSSPTTDEDQEPSQNTLFKEELLLLEAKLQTASTAGAHHSRSRDQSRSRSRDRTPSSIADFFLARWTNVSPSKI